MRNLVLIHLESLNWANYQMNKSLFPTLREWERRSLTFPRYFSTATSTLMAMSDLAYGGMLQNEPCENLADGLGRYCYGDSFLDRLKECGYQVKIYAYPVDGSDDLSGSNQRHFMGYTVAMQEYGSYKTYKDHLDQAITEEVPFAVWTCNYINNVSCNGGIEDIAGQTGLERWESGYLYLDQCVHDLMALLGEKNLLDQTTVVFYGDHGDDLFAHGRHGGLMHAIEPYGALIHTPFWIYDSRFAPGTVNALTDTTDIRGMIEQLISLPEHEQDRDALKTPSRKYSVSRNVYAAQKIRETSFHKAYGLTDGRFLFLAGDRGMELYHILMDEACQHNLLDYFDFDGGRLSLNEALYGRIKYHFSHLMDKAALLQVERIFYEYRACLMREVQDIYEYAGSRFLPLEIEFDRIRYGWEERERRRSGKCGAGRETGGKKEFDIYRRYLEGKKIILYGAGEYGKYFYEKMAGCTDIVAWTDGNYGQMTCVYGQEIQPPDCIGKLNFDFVFIAVMNSRKRKEIKDKLAGMGVAEGRIF